MNTVKQVVEWYREHFSYPSTLTFNPDGMCLMICRLARGLPAMYPSAVAAQEATPDKYRVTRVQDIRKGMVVYYDDPADSNKFGHIVTVVGRVAGEDPSALSSLLVRTNSVKSGQIVVVRGDYFPRYWGDPFKFAATWLNGYAFPEFQEKPEPTPAISGKSANLKEAVRGIKKAIKVHEKAGHHRLVTVLTRNLRSLERTIDRFNGRG